jgi:hypothetical protein
MVELLLQPIESTVSDEEIAGFLSRYGFPAFFFIERMPGTGSRPAVLLVFRELAPHTLRMLQSRIHHVFWNDHTIEAMILPDRTEEAPPRPFG